MIENFSQLHNNVQVAIILIFYFQSSFKFLLKNNSQRKARGISIKHKLSACHTMIEKFSIPRQRAGDSTSDLGLVWESVE
jgi:hypothetical protein